MLSRDIEELITKNESLSLKKLMGRTQETIFGFLLVILALPSALPVPAPGYSIPFGIVIIILAVQIIIGRKYPWLPQKILNKEINIKKFRSGVSKINTFIQFFEKIIKPRGKFLYNQGQSLLGLMIFMCGVSMLIPIPGTNTIPALGIFVIGLGMIEEDGLLGTLGVLISLTGIAVTSAILFFGKEILDIIWNYLF